ncbi:MAG: hypothetical protein OEY89_09945 [Gammaproteobacteria bacterium]|nr:hypothetical protein [Gammaproteobacteria bacterium]
MTAQRMVFLTVAIIVALGIALTGLKQAHWILYVPVIFLGFAGITGICPGIRFWNKLGLK